MHSCQPFMDPLNLCGVSWPGIPAYPIILILHSSSQKCSCSRFPIRCKARCGGVLMLGSLPSSSTALLHHDWVNFEMYSKVVIVWVWRPRSCTLRHRNQASWEIHLDTVIKGGLRCTCRPWSSNCGDHHCGNLDGVFVQDWGDTWRPYPGYWGDVLGGHDQTSLVKYMEAVNLVVVVWQGGTMGAETVFICLLIIVGM